MSDTSGFYKIDSGNPTRLLYAPNFVNGPGFTLLRDTHTTVTYPVDGWTWYDTAAAAYAAVGLPSYVDTEDELDDLTVAIVMGL